MWDRDCKTCEAEEICSQALRARVCQPQRGNIWKERGKAGISSQHLLRVDLEVPVLLSYPAGNQIQWLSQSPAGQSTLEILPCPPKQEWSGSWGCNAYGPQKPPLLSKILTSHTDTRAGIISENTHWLCGKCLARENSYYLLFC